MDKQCMSIESKYQLRPGSDYCLNFLRSENRESPKSKVVFCGPLKPWCEAAQGEPKPAQNPRPRSSTHRFSSDLVTWFGLLGLWKLQRWYAAVCCWMTATKKLRWLLICGNAHQQSRDSLVMHAKKTFSPSTSNHCKPWCTLDPASSSASSHPRSLCSRGLCLGYCNSLIQSEGFCLPQWVLSVWGGTVLHRESIVKNGSIEELFLNQFTA